MSQDYGLEARIGHLEAMQHTFDYRAGPTSLRINVPTFAPVTSVQTAFGAIRVWRGDPVYGSADDYRNWPPKGGARPQ